MGLLWVSFKTLLSKIDFKSFQNGSIPPAWEPNKCPHIWFSEKRAENKLLGRWGTYRRKNNLGGWRSMEGLEAGKNQGVKSLFKAFLITLHLHSWVRNCWSRSGKQPIPIFLPGTFHGQRSLVGYASGIAKSWTQQSDWTCTPVHLLPMWIYVGFQTFMEMGVKLGESRLYCKNCH